MSIEIPLLISIISVAFSVFFGLKSNKRTDVKDIEERVKTDTRINMKLDNIGNNVNDVKNDMSSVKADIRNIDRRLIKVEESAKQAHHRIDGLANRGEINE